jgi:hypothetical protein
MRWRFPHASESAARELVVGRIDAWWRAFEAEVPRLDDYFHRRGSWDLASWMREHLGVVDERIMWEFGPGTRGGGQRLVLTPESEHQLRPLVEVMLARAPALPGWEYHAHRLAEALPAALQTVAERTSVDLAGWQARADVSAEGLVDVELVPPAWTERGDENRAAAQVLVEALLGEDVMDVWLGSVDVAGHGETGGSLVELAPRVLALVELRRALIPVEPTWRRARAGAWTLVHLAPNTGPATDYAGQQDMLVAKTIDFELWKAQHGRRPFHSRRFSLVGEHMGTLKIDGADGLEEGGFADKAAIEDAIAATLGPPGLGGQIGGGTGLRYSYIDLALTDAAAAMDALGPVLRAGKLPKRTWLQFFDAELADEWIPLWEDAPRPPR